MAITVNIEDELIRRIKECEHKVRQDEDGYESIINKRGAK